VRAGIYFHSPRKSRGRPREQSRRMKFNGRRDASNVIATLLLLLYAQHARESFLEFKRDWTRSKSRFTRFRRNETGDRLSLKVSGSAICYNLLFLRIFSKHVPKPRGKRKTRKMKDAFDGRSGSPRSMQRDVDPLYPRVSRSTSLSEQVTFSGVPLNEIYACRSEVDRNVAP